MLDRNRIVVQATPLRTGSQRKHSTNDTMKGITVKQQGTAPEIADDLGLPEPSEHQILVKSIYTAINPVYLFPTPINPYCSVTPCALLASLTNSTLPRDHMMINMGILVQSWPFVPGCDAAGVVVKVGEKATSTFNIGDEVCGCTRLGITGYSTCQEYVYSPTAPGLIHTLRPVG